MSKKRHTIELKNEQYNNLCEALRRFLCFSKRRDGKTVADLETCWTGLGPRSYFKETAEAGLMQIVPGHSYASRCTCWWSLTPLGAAIVRQWIRKGYTKTSRKREVGGLLRSRIVWDCFENPIHRTRTMDVRPRNKVTVYV